MAMANVSPGFPFFPVQILRDLSGGGGPMIGHRLSSRPCKRAVEGLYSLPIA